MLAKTPLKDLMTAWLQLQDPDEYYEWDNPFNCACAQFASTLSEERQRGWYGKVLHRQHFQGEWAELNMIARGPDLLVDPSIWTFGAMLKRMKEDARC